MSDPTVTSQLRTLYFDTFKLSQKCIGAGNQFMGTQKKAWTCDGFTRDAFNTLGPIMNDDYVADASGAGKALGGIFTSMGTAQKDTVTAGDAANTEAQSCLPEIARLRGEVANIAATLPAGPAAVALANAIASFDSATKLEGKTKFDVKDLFSRCDTLLAKSTAGAGEIAADNPKDPKDLTGAALMVNGFVQEIKVNYIEAGARAGASASTQNQVTQQTNNAAAFLQQAIESL